MPIKVNGSSSGSVTLAAPASGSDVTVTLPGTAGTVATLASPAFTGTPTLNGSTLVSSKILQVVSSTLADQFTTTSTGFVDITNMSVSITPAATTSKVFVIVTFGLLGNTDAPSMSLYNLYRNSTAIAQPNANTAMTAGLYANNSGTGHGGSFSFLDSPATTSATTYKVAMRVNGGTGVVNRLALNTNWQSVSTITAMEVAA